MKFALLAIGLATCCAGAAEKVDLLSVVRKRCSLETLGITPTARKSIEDFYASPNTVWRAMGERGPAPLSTKEDLRLIQMGKADFNNALFRKLRCFLDEEKHPSEEICRNDTPVSSVTGEGPVHFIEKNRSGITSDTNALEEVYKAERDCLHPGAARDRVDCRYSESEGYSLDARLNVVFLASLLNAREGRAQPQLSLGRCASTELIHRRLLEVLQKRANDARRLSGSVPPASTQGQSQTSN